MHIALLTSTHSPNDPRIYYKQAKDLISAGHRVTIIAFTECETSPERTNLIALKPRKNRFARVIAGGEFKSAALSLDADLYIIYDPEILRIGRWLAKKGKPFIFDALEPYPDFIAEKEWLPRPFKNFVRRLVAWEEMRGAKASQAILSAMRENDLRLRPAGKPSIVLHNYPRITELAPKLPEKDNTIIYVGVVMAVRFGLEMIKLSEHLRPGGRLEGWELQILGPVYGKGYLDMCKQSAAEFSNTCKLDFPAAFLSYPDALSMVERAKIGLSFIVPSLKYDQCLSGKIFDYMSKGTIPITTWLKAYEGIVSEADGPIFVQPGQESQIVDIIEELISDERAMNQRAELCMKSVREKFNWEKDSVGFIDFVEKVFANITKA